MPGMVTSRIRQLVRSRLSDARKASADANGATSKPNDRSRSGSDSRTDTSSSTTEISFPTTITHSSAPDRGRRPVMLVVTDEPCGRHVPPRMRRGSMDQMAESTLHFPLVRHPHHQAMMHSVAQRRPLHFGIGPDASPHRRNAMGRRKALNHWGSRSATFATPARAQTSSLSPPGAPPTPSAPTITVLAWNATAPGSAMTFRTGASRGA